MAEPKRDRWDRYLLPNPRTGEERAWTRATTLANTVKETYGLDKWGKRMVVLGLVARQDLLDLAFASDPEDKQQLDKLCDDAMAAARAGDRAHKGTALHRFTERLDGGEKVRAPERWQADLDAYAEIKERYGILTHPRMLERITVVPELEVAGTIDKVVKHKSQAKICDLKTGSTIEFSGMEIAMQLAIYAHGEGLWNMAEERWDDMPAVSLTEGLVIHLPAGGLVDANGNPTGEHRATLYSVDIATGWEIAKTAYQIRAWRKSEDLLVPYGAS